MSVDGTEAIGKEMRVLFSPAFGGFKLIIHEDLQDVFVNTDNALGPHKGFQRKAAVSDSETVTERVVQPLAPKSACS